MVEKNKIYEIEIGGLGTNGEGVGRLDDFTIFVEGALPTEKISAQIIEVKKITPSASYKKFCVKVRRVSSRFAQFMKVAAAVNFSI